MMLFKKIFLYLLPLLACNSHDPSVHETGGTSQTYVEDNKNKQSFSAAVILDGHALTQTFQRFFTLNGVILTTKQQHHLGSVSYENEDHMLLNGRRYREINQSYVKTLREVLLQLCQNKTAQEMQALTATNIGDTFAQHTIVKRNGSPQEEDVNAIMTAMFGYEDNHYGTKDYAALVQKNLATVQVSSEDYHQKLQANYVLMCMAIGQDARVYLR